MITLALLGALTVLHQQSTNAEIEKRVADTLSRLTLDQKIDMLSGVRGFYERGAPDLGVPELKMSDGPAGVRNYGPTTAYPAPVCLAASFDPDLAEQFGTAIGRDARSRGVHIWLGPGVNLARIPQNGRNFEYFGEDPVLSGRTVARVVRGVQSQGVVATVKHYAANNHENDRMVDSSEVDERTLRELYLKPFEAAVKDGGAWAVMCSYNKLNGTYASANQFLLTDVLKRDWGFNGVVMSDWGAVHDTLGPLSAGLDLEMPDGTFLNRSTIKPLLESHRVSVSQIDDKVRRILRLTYAMGFADRAQEDPSIPKDDPQNEETALRIARSGAVLLKNRQSLLPIQSPRVRNILVVGPNAQPPVTGGGGSAYTTPAQAVSLLDAIKKEAGPDASILYEPLVQDVVNRAFEFNGFTLPDGSGPGLHMERWNNMSLSGPPATSRNTRGVRIIQHVGDSRPPQTHFSVRWTGTVTFNETGAFMATSRSDDGIRVFLDEKPIIDDWNDHGEKIDTSEVPIEKGRVYRLRIEYYQNDGDAVAQFGFFPLEGTLNQALPVNEIKKADVVIAAIGFSPTLESEGQDRPFSLPTEQQLMMQKLVELNPHVVVVNNSGAGIDMSPWVDKVGAIVQAWYPGGIGNRAIAEILFGKTDPSGKLPTSFPRTLKGTYYETAYPPVDHHVAYKEGLFMGYRWFDANHVDPLFPFGFGLSYTTFHLDRFRVASDLATGVARILVTVRNTGRREGAETVQLYVHSPADRVVQPVKVLKGFQKVTLKPGETREVEIPLKVADLAYFDVSSHSWVLENGKYDLFVGTSSRDLPLKGSLQIGAVATRRSTR